MPHGLRRPALALVLILGAGLAAASCSGPSLPSAADAGPRLQQLSTDLAAALSAAYPGAPWLSVPGQATNLSKNDAGTCHLTIGTLRSKESLRDVPGGWAAVMKTVNPVLREGGFADVTRTDSLKGGYTGISSTDGHGGEVKISEKGATEISVGSDVSDKDCSLQ
ncbi:MULTISPECIES: hypothetical protein [unclassified Arthrobacter]|uniref:hypothetical protein n=1 Tax=unclassified Arthrobacter TaxID=235627 RepID=UPI00159E78EB|nr:MULTISPECIES: hypothetical protein [unclassified Arthrobacter]MCQ9164898.1 hypothetical protein [Arthrobacter sp. STN4]NVM98195.1 hypothetical protein [Arthrobacter sp. SDTb3-6]